MATVELAESGYVNGRELNSLLMIAERPLDLEQDDLVVVSGSVDVLPSGGRGVGLHGLGE